MSKRAARSSVTMTIYNPISENLIATEPGTGGEAKSNCVAARWGGKQLGAKEQSQITVNSIRCLKLASLLEIGEACAQRNPNGLHPPVKAMFGSFRYGWSGNATKDVYVSSESSMDRQWKVNEAMEQSEPPYERGSPVMRMKQREVGK